MIPRRRGKWVIITNIQYDSLNELERRLQSLVAKELVVKRVVERPNVILAEVEILGKEVERSEKREWRRIGLVEIEFRITDEVERVVSLPSGRVISEKMRKYEEPISVRVLWP